MATQSISKIIMPTDKSPASIAESSKPWLLPWPAKDLESINQCPICECEGRKLLHERLIDNVFHAARGQWKLWGCETCGTAYLSPRPDVGSIHAAYHNYYTHGGEIQDTEYKTLDLVRKMRRRFANGYSNWRFGSSLQPSSLMGVPLAFVLPPLRRALNQRYRDLPKPRAGADKLLDIGCGDGSFLQCAVDCGWNSVGIDPDPAAISAAQKKGLAAHSIGVEQLLQDEVKFDVITLSHVIEHVHNPIKTLQSCFNLLKSGGLLWIATPNIDSYGHERFGGNWRGIETPRHLVLLNWNSLIAALRNVGFAKIERMDSTNVRAGLYSVSNSLKCDDVSPSEVASKERVRLLALIDDVKGLFQPNKSEFVVLQAWKN